jgi:hypothetical protein
LCALERRTARGGRDSIDHPKGGHDDLINAAAGVLVDLDLDRRMPLVRLSDVLGADGLPPPLPAAVTYLLVAIAVVGADAAVVYCGCAPGDAALSIVDVEATRLHGGFLPAVVARIAEIRAVVRVLRGVLIFAPPELLRHLSGLTAFIEPLPADFDADASFIFASQAVSGGRVRFCEPVAAKMRRATIAAALTFKAGDDTATALRSALIGSICLKFDEQLGRNRSLGRKVA